MALFDKLVAADGETTLHGCPDVAPPECRHCSDTGVVEIADRFRACGNCEEGARQRLRLGSWLRIVGAALIFWGMAWAAWVMTP